MIMKILPLTVHNPHQLGYIFGSDTLSLVAPDKNKTNLEREQFSHSKFVLFFNHNWFGVVVHF